jgi:hypothetical protein
MGKELNRQLFSEEVQMANKYMNECPIYFVTKEMQIKTTLRSHLTPARKAAIKNTHNKCWRGHRGKGTFHTLLLVGM